MTLSRRRFLALAGLAGAGLTACSGAKKSGGRREATTTTARPVAADEGRAAALAAGLELLAVQTYRGSLDAVARGAQGRPPPAMEQLVDAALDQHQQHVNAWNELLSRTGRPSVTQPDPGLKPAVDAYARATYLAGIGPLGLALERLLASNYVSTAISVAGVEAVRLAGSIHAVEMQHAALFRYLQGSDPVPDPFASDVFSFQAE